MNNPDHITSEDQKHATAAVAHYLRRDYLAVAALLDTVDPHRFGQFTAGILAIFDVIVDEDRREELADQLADMCTQL